MNALVTIRPATHEDNAAIQHVARITWRATYASQIAQLDIEQFLDAAYSPRSLARKVDRLGDGFVVASLNGKVVGFAMAGLNRDGQPELFAIYVVPERQGIGAGKMLWDAAKDTLARLEQPRMCCWVLTTNDRARQFYERHGAFLAEERVVQVGASAIREARYCVTLSAHR